jgi:ribose transport system substrate-binding protein
MLGIAAALVVAAATIGAVTASAAGKVYSIYYSTPFIGNGWRTQAIHTTQAVLKHQPLNGKAKVTIVVSAQNTPASQIASLNNIILQHPDAIVVEPSTPTALQGVIQQACNQHIVVTVFDSPLPNQCTHGWFMNFVSIGKTQAEWIAKTLHGKGNIFQDQGLAGTLVAQQIVQGENSVFKHYPGIKVIGKFYSQFAPGPEEQAVASLLAAHPNVDAVISEAYVTGTFTAFKNANHPIVPVASFAYNGPMVACATTKGATCFLASDPPFQAAYALRGAITILNGGTEPHLTYLNTFCFTTNGTSVPGEKCSPIIVGKNAFPKLSPELAAPVNPPWVSPPLTVKEATGT